jgi:hypothetical protein
MHNVEDLIRQFNDDQERRTCPIELEAERLLWFKVILRAAYDFVLYKDSKDPDLKDKGDDAYHWLFEAPGDRFNSFKYLCQELDLSVECVRNFVLTLPRSKIVKIEFLGRSKKYADL